MHRTSNRPAVGRGLVAGAIALLALTLSFAGSPGVSAQQAAVFPMTVTQNRVPGASGQVTITPLGNSQIRVDIRLAGLPPNQARAAHIHTAPGAVCDNNAPVTYPLTNVTVDGSGNGTSSSTVTLTADKPVQANNAYVNVHEAAAPPGNGVICANVTQAFTAQGAAGGQAAAPGAPSTGTGGLLAQDNHSSWIVLELAAVAVLLAGAGLTSVVRRR